MYIEDGIVYMENYDWEVVEYCAEVKCPHCGKYVTIYCTNPIFSYKTFECDECGKTFEVNSDII